MSMYEYGCVCSMYFISPYYFTIYYFLIELRSVPWVLNFVVFYTMTIKESIYLSIYITNLSQHIHFYLLFILIQFYNPFMFLNHICICLLYIISIDACELKGGPSCIIHLQGHTTSIFSY